MKNDDQPHLLLIYLFLNHDGYEHVAITFASIPKMKNLAFEQNFNGM